MKQRIAVFAAMIIAATTLDTNAAVLGTSFTYQGQLKSQGAPLTGTVDLEVGLFDVDSGGVALDMFELNNVPVSNGLFSVELDFGAEAFNGDSRWLEIAVRSPHDPSGTGVFATLTPRQSVTPTPYALQTRGLFVDAAGNIGIGTDAPEYALHVESSEPFALRGVNSTYIGASGISYGADGTGVHGKGTFGVMGVSDSEDGIGVNGFNLANTGANYGGKFSTWSDIGYGVYGWAKGRNGINYGVYGETASDTGYAGYFKGGRNYFEGNVGIGVESPSYPLHIETDSFRAIHAETTGTHALSGFTSSIEGHGVVGHATATSGFTYGGSFLCYSPEGRGVFARATATSGQSYGGKFSSSSNAGYGVFGEAGASSGTNYGVAGKTNSPDGYAGHFTGGMNYFEGNVGIGWESPTHALQVHSGGDRSVFAVNSNNSGYALYGLANVPSGSATAVYGLSRSPTGHGVHGHCEDSSGVNFGVLGETASATGFAGYFKGGKNYFEGRVGIGVDAPAARLQVDAPTAESPFRLRINGSTKLFTDGDGRTVIGKWRDTTDATLGVEGPADLAAFRVRVDGDTEVLVHENHYVAIGGNITPAFQLHVSGDGTAGKPGGGSWAVSSDRRLKKNVRDLDGSLDRLLRLRSVSFEYKNPEAINELPGTRIGMIAQEVEEVFPDWVSTAGHGYKTVAYQGFEALTVDALRELRTEKDTQIESLKEENAAMREQNRDLQWRLERLEALVLAEEDNSK